jgi:hypothetical protein
MCQRGTERRRDTERGARGTSDVGRKTTRDEERRETKDDGERGLRDKRIEPGRAIFLREGQGPYIQSKLS